MKPVILIARPRSGTTAFRLIVSRHRLITTAGEIFHGDYTDHPDRFYNYYLAAITREPTLALPAADHRITLFKGYVDHLCQTLQARYPDRAWVFLGVNYNSLHTMNTYWQNIYEPPYLMEMLRRNDYPVVHIIRRNILAAAISEARAKATGVWHIEAGAERPAAADDAITVDPAALLRELHTRKLEIDLVGAALRDHKTSLTLYYEELFNDAGRADAEQLRRVSDLLELAQPIAPTPTYQRTRSASLRAAIRNYDEVKATLARTEFAQFLDQRRRRAAA